MSVPTAHEIGDEVREPLWHRELPLARDRQDTISSHEIALAAFELAEQPGGLSSTSVKRVANRLGVPANRLEQYLPGRGDLLDLMLDVALGEISSAESGQFQPWREQLESTAHALRDLALRHPWVVELIGGRPPSGPNGLSFMEGSLRALTSWGLPVIEAAKCVNAIHAFACGSVQMHLTRVASRPTFESTDYLQAAVRSPELVNLAELFAQPAGLGPDEAFNYGLACILDGISIRIQQVSDRGPR